jgi:hypothetical protein
MAKRFTDTNKWDKAWFRKLSPRLKCAWDYLTTRCDHAGAWSIDTDALAFHVGEPVTLAELVETFGERVEVRGEHLLLTTFVEFQYGELNPENRVHRSVLDRLARLPLASPICAANKPLGSPLEGAKDKDKDKDKDKEQDKGGVGGFAPTQRPALPAGVTRQQVDACAETWADTLRALGYNRPLAPTEKLAIARGILQHGAEAMDLALYGARHEPRSRDYDPKAHVSLERILGRNKAGKSLFADFMNWGAAHRPSGGAKVSAADEQAERDLEMARRRLRGEVESA